MKPSEMKIKNVLELINCKKGFLLPAIQRSYVWREDQISSLLDSLMRGYPTGTLLLWEKPKGDMYMFISEYKKRERNKFADAKLNPKYSVLDGQQRITSLYIAFMGKYEGKDLYFDTKSGKDGDEYSFAFLNESEIKKFKEQSWISVKEIVLKKLTEIRFNELGIAKTQRDSVQKVYDIYHLGTLSCYVLSGKEETDILEIFKRVNSGGIKLSKTDFLFSSLITSWKDGKRLIKDLVDDVQDILGETSRIDGDFILRTAMYLLGLETKVSIKNLCSNANIEAISQNWSKLENSIIVSAKLVQSWGFSKDCVVSFSAFLPIAYVVFTKQASKKSAETIDSKYRDLLKKFFVFAQLNKLFNSSVENKLKDIRTCMDSHDPWKELERKWVSVFKYSKKDAGKILMKYNYADKNYCFLILTLLNPGLNYNKSAFHIDHLHPKSFFLNKKDGTMGKGLSALNIPEEKKKKWMEMCNQLPNLGLLMGPYNQSKGDKTLAEWLMSCEQDCKDNFVKSNWNTKINDFESFFEKRKNAMEKKLADVLSKKPRI